MESYNGLNQPVHIFHSSLIFEKKHTSFQLGSHSVDKLKAYPFLSSVQIAGANLALTSGFKRMNLVENREPIKNKYLHGIHQEEIDILKEENKFFPLVKSDNDRLAERIFNEIHYRTQNETRIRNEIEKIKHTISELEQNLITSKEVQMKKELGDLLIERNALANLENILHDDILQFKELYENNKKEKDKLNSKGSQVNQNFELHKLQIILKKKEQIDCERLRLTKNLEKIMKKDFQNIQRNVTNLLREEQAKILKTQFFTLPRSDSEYLQLLIKNSTGRIKDLRKSREELLFQSAMTDIQNKKSVQGELIEKMNAYLKEILDKNMPTHERAEKLNLFRNKVSSYINEEGLINPLNYQKAFDIIESLQRKERTRNIYNKSESTSEKIYVNPNNQGNNFSLSNESNHKISKSFHGGLNPGYSELYYNEKTHEAKILAEHQVRERELQKTLNLLPTESPLYRQKLVETIELRQIINELEKIVEEQNLQEEWRKNLNQGQGEKDIEQMKIDIGKRLRNCMNGALNQGPLTISNRHQDETQIKKDIAARFRHNVLGSKSPLNYDRNAGFNLTYDWIGGLPHKYKACQIVYAVVTKGEIIVSPKLGDLGKCQIGKGHSQKCVFKQRETVFGVPPHMEALVIFELQGITHIGEQIGNKPEVIGWTMVDLFDMMKLIKKGKWKLPVYSKPTNAHITINRIKTLKRLKDLWFYLRIFLPTDENAENDERCSDEILMQQYEIPEIHLRFWSETATLQEDYINNLYNSDFESDTRSLVQPKILNLNQGHLNYDDNKKKLVEQKNVYKEIIKNLLEEDKGSDDLLDQDGPTSFNLLDELERSNRDIQSYQKKQVDLHSHLDISINFDYSKGLKLIIVGLRNFSSSSRFKITGGIMEESTFVIDENAKDCVFSTKAKILNDLFEYRFDKSEDNLHNNMKNSIQVEENIVFNEEFYFLRNLPGLILMKQNNFNLFLVIQVIGIDDTSSYKIHNSQQKKSKLRDSILGDKNEKDSTIPQKNNKDSFHFISWHVVKLNKRDGGIIEGRFIEDLYKPPMVKPPFEGKKLLKTGAKIEFILEEYIYNANTLKRNKHKENFHAKNDTVKKPTFYQEERLNQTNKDLQKVASQTQNMKEVLKPPIVQILFKPFIENKQKQYQLKTFEKGSGIDIYIDGARFLPDNVTIAKATLNVFTQDKLTIIKPQSAFSDLNSPILSPSFRFKVELRANYLSPTSILFISLETIDLKYDEVRTIGYCALNIFTTQNDEPPSSENDIDVMLKEGHYQLPIYCQVPNMTKPFTFYKLMNLDKIPCSSLLIRIFKAPTTKDGMIVLSKAYVSETEWIEKGVDIPAPTYESGKYNNELCILTDAEYKLFPQRQNRVNFTTREIAINLMKNEGITNPPDDKEILAWLESKIVKSNTTELLDMIYFAKYQSEFGFMIAVDGFHNVPEKVPYINFCCINPPGALTTKPLDSRQIYVNSNINWESPIMSPQFLEGFFYFKNISVRQNLTIIFEVRAVAYKKSSLTLKTIGWTVLPVFNQSGYVQSGIYQLPIFKGPLPLDTLSYISSQDAWPYLMNLMSMKNSPVQLLEPMSIIVRLLDGQREGHFSRRFDFERINYKYLPSSKSHLYVYNSAVEEKLKSARRLATIVPSKFEVEEFQAAISTAVKESFEA